MFMNSKFKPAHQIYLLLSAMPTMLLVLTRTKIKIKKISFVPGLFFSLNNLNPNLFNLKNINLWDHLAVQSSFQYYQGPFTNYVCSQGGQVVSKMLTNANLGYIGPFENVYVCKKFYQVFYFFSLVISRVCFNSLEHLENRR